MTQPPEPQPIIKPAIIAAIKSAIFLFVLQHLTIYAYVAHLYHQSTLQTTTTATTPVPTPPPTPIPPPPPPLPVERTKPDPIIVVEDAEVIDEIVTKQVFRVRDELTQDQLRRIRFEEAAAAAAAEASGGEYQPNHHETQDDDDDDAPRLTYQNSRETIRDLSDRYQSLTDQLINTIRTIEENRTDIRDILQTYRTKNAHVTTTAQRQFRKDDDEGMVGMSRGDIADAAERDASTWMMMTAAVEEEEEEDFVSMMGTIVGDYKEGVSMLRVVEGDLMVYLGDVTDVARRSLKERWDRVTNLVDDIVAASADHHDDHEEDEKDEHQNDNNNNNDETPTPHNNNKRMATKQDLEEFTTTILQRIYQELKQYYTVLLPTTNTGSFLLDELQQNITFYRDNLYPLFIFAADGRRDRLVGKLEERYEKNLMILRGGASGGGGGGAGYYGSYEECVTDDQVRYMVDGGIDAMFRRGEVRSSVVDAVTRLYVTDEEDGEGGVEEYVQRRLNEFQLDSSSSNRENDREYGGGVQSSSSSWEHADSLRMVVLENPLFPQVLKRLDSFVQTVEGHVDLVDQLIDYVVGEEDGAEGGRSFGSSVGEKLAEILGGVQVPPVFEEMKQKAGILHSKQL